MTSKVPLSHQGVNAVSPHVRRVDTRFETATLHIMTSEPDWKAVGERIRKACEAKGFSKHWQLSDALGKGEGGRPVPTETISRWLNGKQPPKRYLLNIAQALDVSPDWLAWGDAGAPVRDAEREALDSARALLEKAGYDVVKVARIDRKVSGTEEIRPLASRRKRLHK
jgi:transcriptional regulator with XRE-family HTH domain